MTKGDPIAKQDDPGGVRAGINRYRDLAKWIITIFAAVGGLLVAGSQLSSLGKLDLSDDWPRLLVAVLGLALAVGMAFLVIQQALRILVPLEARLDETGELDSGSRAEGSQQFEVIQKIPRSVLSTQHKRDLLDEPSALLDRKAYDKATETFKDAWKKMAGYAAAAAVGITLFAYASNPAEPADGTTNSTSKSSSATPPQPSTVIVKLNERGTADLGSALGKKCVESDVNAIAIGGSEASPVLVSVSSDSCELVRFTLSPEQGIALATETAPTPDG